MKDNKLEIVYKNVDDLIPYARNSRTHSEQQVNQIASSIKEFGMNAPIAIDADGGIIAGHGRVLACQKLGIKTVPTVCLSHLSETEKKAYIIADNKLALNAGWDLDLLKVELQDLETDNFDLSLTGFDEEELKDLLGEETAEDIEEGEVEEPPENPKSQKGDIWILGEHRLMCGDSTSKEDVKLLMNGERAEIAFTSPPYNAGKTATESGMNKESKYANDSDNKSESEYLDFLCAFTHNTLDYCDFSFVNIQSLSNNKVALIDYLYSMKNFYADTIIWDKIHGQPAMAENVLNSVFEYIHIFSNKATRAIGAKKFRGTLDNIIHIQKQTNNEFSKIHNATFPIDFANYFVSNFSNHSVLDLFGGTGTTLIVCEQNKRKAYLMELEPKYVDVIIQRWQKLTNKEAVRVDGVKFNDLQA